MSTTQSEPSKVFQYGKSTSSSRTKKKKLKFMKHRESLGSQRNSKLFSRISSRLHPECETSSASLPQNKRMKTSERCFTPEKKGECFAHGGYKSEKDFENLKKNKFPYPNPQYFLPNPACGLEGGRYESCLPSSCHVLYHYHHHHHHHGTERLPETRLRHSAYNHRNGKILIKTTI